MITGANDWIKIGFSLSDARWQSEVAEARQRSKGDAAIADRKRIDPRHTTEETNLFGVRAEHAVSILLPHALFDWMPHEKGDGGVKDFRLGHLLGQVKGTWYNKPALGRGSPTLTFNPGEFKADLAVLATDTGDRLSCFVVGWIMRGAFMGSPERRGYELGDWGYGERWLRHWMTLEPLADLIAIDRELA